MEILSRSCAQCGAQTTRPKFCSTPCNSAFKYERGKRTGREAAARAARNAKYVPKPKARHRFCEVPGCGRRHCAKGLCAKHYKLGKDGCLRPVYGAATAMVRRYGHGDKVPRLVVIRPMAPAGAFVYCPNPNCQAVTYATSLWTRVCHTCHTTVEVNEEEASWVVYESLLTRPLLKVAC